MSGNWVSLKPGDWPYGFTFMSPADRVVLHLAEKWVHWHRYRWSDWHFTQPPRGVEEPCGDCGRAKSDHPIPRINPTFKETEILGRMIIEAVDAML